MGNLDGAHLPPFVKAHPEHDHVKQIGGRTSWCRRELPAL
jgi:hypothetical protein